MKRQYRIILMIIACICLFLWWRADFYDEKQGLNEISVENGQDTFTASFDKVYYIAVANEDVTLASVLEDQPSTLAITIAEKDGSSQSDCVSDGIRIHTDAYTSTESSNFSDMPIELTPGKEYSLFYKCALSDGTYAEDLSFMLYGTEKSSNKYSAVIFLIAALAICLCIYSGTEKRGYATVWALVTMLALFSMPMLESAQETSAFGNVYSASSLLLGKNDTSVSSTDERNCTHTSNDNYAYISDKNYAYIEESGIRNNGYLSYSVPLMRFWSDWSYGNSRQSQLESINYNREDGGVNALQLPSVIAVAAARLVKAPYQIVMMSGWIINALITGLLLILLRSFWKDTAVTRNFVSMVFLLPSVIYSSLSYSAYGIFIALSAWFVSFLINIQGSAISKSVIRKSVKSKVSFIIISAMLIVSLAGRLISGWGDAFSGGIAGFTGALFNTLISDFDRLLNEFITYSFFDHDYIFTASYLLLGILIIFKYKSDYEITAGSKLRTINLSYSLGLWIAAYVLISAFSKCSIEETGIGKFSLMTGTSFIPLIFIPYNVKKAMFEKSEYSKYRDDIIKVIFVICSCIVMLSRFSYI